MFADFIHLIIMAFIALPLSERLIVIILIGCIILRLLWPIFKPHRRKRWRFRAFRLPFRYQVPLQESPIEEAFRLTWAQMYPQIPLIPQYPIGSYRVDFAHVASRVVVELDGFEAHSSTRQIEHDCRRQREIMRRGWLVFRFGGREVHYNPRCCAQETYEFILQRHVANR